MWFGEKMKWRISTDQDFDLLAEWNHQLIADEGHRNPMDIPELRERMKRWLSEDYRAIVFSETQDVAYALFREDEKEIYLRQFFVRRDRRGEGFGSMAIALLRSEVWPDGLRLTVDVLTANPSGIAFWRAMGYQDYCLTLEVLPDGRHRTSG